jgi:hypothetical protein
LAVVVEGMDVVDSIREMPTTARAGHRDVPVDEILIHEARLVDGEGES